MRRRVRRSIVVWIGLVMLVSSSPGLAPQGRLLAQESSTFPMGETEERTELVISYTREETPKEDVAASMEVVDRESLEKMPATNAAEVLQYVPGVYVESSAGPASPSFASIQGADFRHVAVYRDGVPLNLLANPIADLTLMSVNSIERIEVYKGAASSSWGSSLGGVVNIITRDPVAGKPFSAEIESTYGDFRTFRENALVSGTVDRFGYLVSLGHNESSGFIPDTGYKLSNAYGKLHYYVGSSGRVSFVYSFDRNDLADPTPQYADFWDDVHLERSYQRILYETSLTDQIGMEVEARHYRYGQTIHDVFADHRELYQD